MKHLLITFLMGACSFAAQAETFRIQLMDGAKRTIAEQDIIIDFSRGQREGMVFRWGQPQNEHQVYMKAVKTGEHQYAMTFESFEYQQVSSPKTFGTRTLKIGQTQTYRYSYGKNQRTVHVKRLD